MRLHPSMPICARLSPAKQHWHDDHATDLRPRGRGPRQFDPPRTRQRPDPGPAAGELVLCHRARAYARPLPDGRRQQYVDQCRTQSVPPADRQAAGAARPYRHRDRWPRGAARAACVGAREARRHTLQFQPSTTTMSRRPARGAIASLSTSPMPRASAASRSAFPMSSSTCLSGPRPGIAAFYRAMVDTPAKVVNGDGTVARIMIGKGQHLLFRETDRPLPEFDEHHIAIYVANFSGPHGRLRSATWSTVRTTIPVSLPRYRRSRLRQASFHDRARGAQRHSPDVFAAAGQPQSGADQPELLDGSRRVALGDGPQPLRQSALKEKSLDGACIIRAGRR